MTVINIQVSYIIATAGVALVLFAGWVAFAEASYKGGEKNVTENVKITNTNTNTNNGDQNINNNVITNVVGNSNKVTNKTDIKNTIDNLPGTVAVSHISTTVSTTGDGFVSLTQVPYTGSGDAMTLTYWVSLISIASAAGFIGLSYTSKLLFF